jgi:hypothetical protein
MLSISLANLLSSLAPYNGLLESCSVEQLDLFVRLTSHLQQELDLHIPLRSLEPPHRLPQYIHIFLVEMLQLDGAIILQLWDALKAFVWSQRNRQGNGRLSEEEMDQFDRVGSKILRKEEKLGEVYLISSY